ncbi:hypothetical protein CLIB1423_01S06282 [[Candida] railenensis]|uniref:Uncharacterized protein n=1 Tax=[Candida] railenensis TaxID=45579 RepID=A0A9P0QKG1_9ASCO|nr:hypothetical protein CLIB1423_01S06282 [[Candida] railenensis]
MSNIQDQRFHLFPHDRIKVVGILGATVGGFQGFYEGIKISSLRYLTENGHRLPKKVGGWYFYHKKKNYVMLLDGIRGSFIQSSKTALAVCGFFGLEYCIDKYARNGTIDFFNTVGAAMISGGIFGAYKNLSRVQIWKNVKRGGYLGLSLGITQDLLIWTRGGRVWYIDKLGIKNPRFDTVSSSEKLS